MLSCELRLIRGRRCHPEAKPKDLACGLERDSVRSPDPSASPQDDIDAAAQEFFLIPVIPLALLGHFQQRPAFRLLYEISIFITSNLYLLLLLVHK